MLELKIILGILKSWGNYDTQKENDSLKFLNDS